MKKRVVVALGGNALGNSLPEQKIAEADIDKYFNFALKRGFRHTEAIIDLVKAQIHLNDQEKLTQLIKQAEDEFGDNFPIIVANTVYEQAKTERKG